MRRTLALTALLLMQMPAATAESNDRQAPLRVLMTIGGVGYNTWIVRMLESNRNIGLTLRDVDEDGVVFTADALSNVDAVLMYHRDNVAEPEERAALLDYLANGGAVVVLHHSIANYPDWEVWWRDHVGGLYVLPNHEGLEPSRYFPDFTGVARPVSDHPVTRRLGSFWRIVDESYDRLWISDATTILLTTTAVGSETRLAWIGPSNSGSVVFIQPGHGEHVMRDPKYLMLIEDALRWAAGRLK